MTAKELVERFTVIGVAQDEALLDDLVAPKIGCHKKARPIPDPLYMLDDNELEAYSAFRHRMDAESRRG